MNATPDQGLLLKSLVRRVGNVEAGLDRLEKHLAEMHAQMATADAVRAAVTRERRRLIAAVGFLAPVATVLLGHLWR